MTIPRVTGAIEVDGALDEPAWQGAVSVPLPYEWFPADNEAPPVATDVLLAYDSERLYVGFKAHDPEPTAIRAHLMDRDEIDTFVQDDHILLQLDTFNDERRAFQFRVNPLGVQADAIFSQIEGVEDFSFDLIWASAGRITEDGYEVEIAIPFDQLRFPATGGELTWGLDLGRSYPRDVRHRIANTRRERDVNCLLCQAAKVSGFEDLEPGRNLVVTPTVTAHRTDELDSFPDGSLQDGDEELDPGVSVRWGVTPNLTFNGTINPDFSQVEADVAQLDVNESFALFFPEKRPFFLEGVDFFTTLIDAVFTRTVADPKWGGKLTGKIGHNAVGVFATQDEVNNLLIPGVDRSRLTSLDDEVTGSVLRYRRDVGQSSTLGVLYTGREADDYHNRVAGLDGFFRFSDTESLSFQYLRSDTLYPEAVAAEFDQPTDAFDDDALEILYSHEDRNWFAYGRWRDFGPRFRSDSGFVTRVDARRWALQFGRNWWPKQDRWWDRIQVQSRLVEADDHDGQRTDEIYEIYANVQGPWQSTFEIQWGRSGQFFDGILHEDLDSGYLFTTFQPTGALRFELFWEQGETLDFANNRPADQKFFNGIVESKIGRHVNLQLDYTYQHLDADAGKLFTANLTQLRAVYNISTRMFVRGILQYTDITRDPSHFVDPVDPRIEQLFSQLLFSYQLNPETVLFLGYSDNGLGLEDVSLTRTDRTLFLKIGYAWIL
ncbi:MAG: DUF5916 domain-containing protein [Thermoanaerobaculia bacterium]